jgi:hypothetical protein
MIFFQTRRGNHFTIKIRVRFWVSFFENWLSLFSGILVYLYLLASIRVVTKSTRVWSSTCQYNHFDTETSVLRRFFSLILFSVKKAYIFAIKCQFYLQMWYVVKLDVAIIFFITRLTYIPNMSLRILLLAIWYQSELPTTSFSDRGQILDASWESCKVTYDFIPSFGAKFRHSKKILNCW